MNNSLDALLARLNAGDEAVVKQLFLAFEPYMRMAIRRRIAGSLARNSILPISCNLSGSM